MPESVFRFCMIRQNAFWLNCYMSKSKITCRSVGADYTWAVACLELCQFVKKIF